MADWKEASLSIKAARVNAEMSIMEASEELGISRYKLSRYENGYTEIPARTLRMMGDLYNVPFECLRLEDE